MVPGVSSGAMAGQQAAGVGVAAGAAVAGGAEERVDDRRVRRGPVAGRRAATAGTPECERAADAGVPFAWVTGDEACGGNPKLRRRLEERRLPYVMAVACSEPVAVQAGSFRADDLAALVPAGAWQRLSCADGSTGPRLYDWALIETADAGHWLLARRFLNRNARGELELAFFRCWSPRPVTLAELVAVAGAVGSRGLLRRGEERDRAGPLPGPQVPGLVPARHLVHARPRVPRRHRARRPPRAPGQRERRRRAG